MKKGFYRTPNGDIIEVTLWNSHSCYAKTFAGEPIENPKHLAESAQYIENLQMTPSEVWDEVCKRKTIRIYDGRILSARWANHAEAYFTRMLDLKHFTFDTRGHFGKGAWLESRCLARAAVGAGMETMLDQHDHEVKMHWVEPPTKPKVIEFRTLFEAFVRNPCKETWLKIFGQPEGDDTLWRLRVDPECYATGKRVWFEFDGKHFQATHFWNPEPKIVVRQNKYWTDYADLLLPLKEFKSRDGHLPPWSVTVDLPTGELVLGNRELREMLPEHCPVDFISVNTEAGQKENAEFHAKHNILYAQSGGGRVEAYKKGNAVLIGHLRNTNEEVSRKYRGWKSKGHVSLGLWAWLGCDRSLLPKNVELPDDSFVIKLKPGRYKMTHYYRGKRGTRIWSKIERV